jgi:hypothetical protein
LFLLFWFFGKEEMMKCEVCDWPSEARVWVRPKKGGRRKAHFFCDETCKQVGLRVLDAQGLEETHAVLGWDVFRPIWQEDE